MRAVSAFFDEFSESKRERERQREREEREAIEREKASSSFLVCLRRPGRARFPALSAQLSVSLPRRYEEETSDARSEGAKWVHNRGKRPRGSGERGARTERERARREEDMGRSRKRRNLLPAGRTRCGLTLRFSLPEGWPVVGFLARVGFLSAS